MTFLEFLGNIVTGIFLGYITLTTGIAEKIDSLIGSSKETVLVEHTGNTEEKLDPIPEAQSGISGSIQRILLDHPEYQKAAAVASAWGENASPPPTDAPIGETLKDALVNIFCQYKTDEYIRTTTGSGFIINPKGIILTNAHVAQFLLLHDSKNPNINVECIVRTGDPATPAYTAELLYISPTWIYENSNLITQESPRGTGERDYALLYIAKSITNNPLPAQFPSLPFDTSLLSRGLIGEKVVTAGYPAEALMRAGANALLTPVVAETNVSTLYTFGSNYADIFSITESAVGEEGASGGPVVTTDKNAIGLIVTKGDAELEGAQSLRALSLSYIDRTIIEETGFSLAQNMQGDVAYRGEIFKKVMVPFLAEILEGELQEE